MGKADNEEDCPILTHSHSFKSTWQNGDKKKWNISQRFIYYAGIEPTHSRPPPVFPKEAKVPYVSDWQQHLWIIPRATFPLALHWLFMKTTGATLHPIVAFIFYVFCFVG